MIAVLDYGAGNLKSVALALAAVEASFVVTKDPKQISGCDKLVFPGVGEARAAMDALNSSGLIETIKAFAKSGKPFLGICIGCQISLDRSEERDTECLGLLPGVTKRFADIPGRKVPHMGWNSVRQAKAHPLFDGIPDESSFYFVHSYYPVPADPSLVTSMTDYEGEFVSSYAKGSMFFCQFHPEKSGRVGLRLLSNFAAL